MPVSENDVVERKLIFMKTEKEEERVKEALHKNFVEARFLFVLVGRMLKTPSEVSP